MPHFTHRYLFFVREKSPTSAVIRPRIRQGNGETCFSVALSCASPLCEPWRGLFLCVLDQDSDSVSSSKPYSTFPPIRFSFPLNSLTLTPPLPHIHLAHTPRYLICGLGSQIVALRFGSQSFLCHREPWVQNLHHTSFHESRKSVPSMPCLSQ